MFRLIKKLKVKILIIIIISMLFLIALGGGVNYSWNLRLQSQLHATLDSMQQVVFKDILLQMISGDKEKIRQEIATQVKNPKIDSITLSDASGKIIFSEYEERAKPSPRKIKILVNNSKPLNISLEKFPTTQFLLKNQPRCFQCHGKEAKTLGILEIAFSPDIFADGARGQITSSLIIILCLIFLTLLGMGFFIHRIIQVPLIKLNEAILNVHKGDLTTQVEIPSHDELGRIARNFNKMINSFHTTTQALDKKVGELYVINEVGKAMTSIFDLDELLRLIIILATEELQAETGSLMLIDKESNELTIKTAIGIEDDIIKKVRIKVGEGISGWVAEKGKPLLISDVENDPRFRKARSGKRYDTKSLLSVPLLTHGTPVGVINVNNKRQGEIFTTDDLDLLSTLASQASVAIDNANLHEYLIEKERMDREMEIAHEIQMSLMPKDSPDFPNFNINAVSIPALQVGGDYYDFIHIDENSLGVAIGDVSGKGMPAALLMVMARSFIYTEARDTLSPGMVLSRINELILANKDESRPDMFITLFYCVINSEDSSLTFANAGHDPQLLFLKESSEPQELYSGDIMVGTFPNIEYHEQTLQLNPGDLLLLYTDGIVEARNKNKELFGEERLINLILKNRDKEIGEIRELICDTVHEFVGDQPASDDLTLVLVRYEEEYDVVKILRINDHYLPLLKELSENIKCDEYFTPHRKNMILNNLTADKIPGERFVSEEKLLELEIQSSLQNLPMIEALIKLTANSIDFEDKEEISAVIVALNEAIVNAIKYGNKNDSHRTIKLSFTINDKGLVFSVKDCGLLSFDPDKVTNPTSDANLLFKSSGRGVFMMKSFMDSVKFQKEDDGMLVVMTKSLKSSLDDD